MNELFKDILNIDAVKGIMLFSFNGELIYKKFLAPLTERPEDKDWWPLFVTSLQQIGEADLIYEKDRIYLRKTEVGYLFVLMDIFSPIALVRLNCDILLPTLTKKGLRKGLGPRVNEFKL